MKKITIALFLILGMATQAQDQYSQKMGEAFGLWKQNKATESSQLFERIANAEPQKWLPMYYAAQINILTSFGIKDEEFLTEKLNKAQLFLDKAKEISPKNEELLVLQAFWYTVWIAYDGATYGPMYAGKVSKIYKNAYNIAPKNPRVVLAKAEWDMGSARYFNKDITPYCKDIEKAIELFDIFEQKTPFYPSWGKQRAEQVLNQCK
ncbi:hypothetical protein [Wenyingzhuangia sp. 2_MG-2023]|uniref:hypothetical protein n=1 Tax=Wenyingzhuangia sp. 2_MG-2023 TaxID=3062639 RepID=UPI0026E393BD|nr:hypothetical protein [Wenyingzhuangia sp. 2_MG-2023]MDO6738304.1 hypothetical protein [Wenyingzhuangia sp. 2_MG-2023]